MGTRALTVIKNSAGNELVRLYRQSDGYQDCHGKELKQFLCSKKMVNGIREYSDDIANGVECLAAQLIARLKTRVGLHYLCPTGKDVDFIDFVYTIYPKDQSECPDICIKVESFDEVIFDGLVKDYEPKDIF